MNCTQSQDLLIAFVHGELEPRKHRSLGEHLGTCPDCALQYTRLQLDLEGVWRAHASSPRPQVREALRERIRQEFAPWWRRALGAWTRPVPAYGLVAALALPLIAWGVVSPHQVPPRASLDAVPPSQTPPATPTIADYDGSVLTHTDPSLL